MKKQQKKYLFGRLINFNRKADALLRSTFGIGRTKSRFYLAKFGLSKRVSLIKKPKFIRRFTNLESLFDKRFILDSALRKIVNRSINFAIRFRAYKGIRRRQGLPFSGQRTHSNAKTTRKLFRAKTFTLKLARAGAVGTKQNKGKKL
jgi:ribosomal protein S13